jgi:hypothetical protein
VLVLVQASDWVWVADVDEFLNIHVGNHTIPDLIQACGNPQAISVMFQFFANCDIAEFEDRPVIEQFTRSHNPDVWCADTAIEVKTLTRKDFPLQYYGAHRPFFREKMVSKDQWPRWRDASGRDVPHQFLVAAVPRRVRKFPAQGARKFATLNHYALRSLDSYLVKNDRGDVNRENRDLADGYWSERNDPAHEDLSIRRYVPALHAALAELKSAPEIAALHERAVALHKAKRDELMAKPDYAALYDHLKALPPYPPEEWALMQELGLVQ